MQDDCGPAGLSGQALVFGAWRDRLFGRGFIAREDLDLSAIACELAHVSVLAREGGTLCFRLAGTGLRHAFGCESRGCTVDQIEACLGAEPWGEAAWRTLARGAPSSGRTRLADGSVHYWLRLPMSSDGTTVDLVLCHDRYLPPEALADPDRAAREADLALRLDTAVVQAA